MKRFFLFLAFILHNSYFMFASDWPQLQRDPQRTGHTPDTPSWDGADWLSGGSGEYTQQERYLKQHNPVRKWNRDFYAVSERIAQRSQPIVYNGKVYIGSMQGTMYALDRFTGEDVWKAKIDPVGHTAGADDGRVFATSPAGHLTALDADTGAVLWKFHALGGFNGAPLLAEGAVFVISRWGVAYRVSQADGKAEWSYDVGAPVFQTPAYNDGLVFFAGQDMHAYALDAKTGELAWKSERLAGSSFHEYFPVIWKGKVVFSAVALFANRSRTYASYYPEMADWCGTGGAITTNFWPYFGALITGLPEGYYGWYPAAAYSPTKGMSQERAKQYVESLSPEEKQALRDKANEGLSLQQAALVEWYRKYPAHETMHFLDEKTGKKSGISGVLYTAANCGSMFPPVAGADGFLYLPITPIQYNTNPGGTGYWYGKLDPETLRFVEIALTGGLGRCVVDETAGFITAGDWVMKNFQERDGAVNLKTGQATALAPACLAQHGVQCDDIDVYPEVSGGVMADGWYYISKNHRWVAGYSYKTD